MVEAIFMLVLHLAMLLVCALISRDAIKTIMDNLYTVHSYIIARALVYLDFGIFLSLICLKRISIVIQYIEVI